MSKMKLSKYKRSIFVNATNSLYTPHAHCMFLDMCVFFLGVGSFGGGGVELLKFKYTSLMC